MTLSWATNGLALVLHPHFSLLINSSENIMSLQMKNKGISSFFLSIFVKNHRAHTLLGTVIHLFIPAYIQLYLGWSFSLVFLSRLVEHTLCLEQLLGCLFQPLYTCSQTNLRVIYSGQTRGWSESTLILTNERRANLIRVDQSQASKSAKR